jgi:hypothetical protein
MWFCVVFALAVGWGTHVRYSTLLESPELSRPYAPPIPYERLQQENNEQRDRIKHLTRDNAGFRYAVEEALNDDQKKEFMAKKRHMEGIIDIRENP